MDRRSLIKQYGYSEDDIFSLIRENFDAAFTRERLQSWLDSMLRCSWDEGILNMLIIPEREWHWADIKMSNDEWERLTSAENKIFFDHLEALIDLAAGTREDWELWWDTREREKTIHDYCNGFMFGLYTAMHVMNHPHDVIKYREIEAIKKVYALCKAGWFPYYRVDWGSPHIFEKTGIDWEDSRIEKINDRIYMDYRIWDKSIGGAVLIRLMDGSWLRFLIKPIKPFFACPNDQFLENLKAMPEKFDL